MEFFNRVKMKLKIKNLFSALLCLASVALFSWIAVSNGFSSETQWEIGVRGIGSGIPVPNWLVSGFLLLIGFLFLASAVSSLLSFVKDTEYKEMLQNVCAMGDVDMIGTMIATPKRVLMQKAEI